MTQADRTAVQCAGRGGRIASVERVVDRRGLVVGGQRDCLGAAVDAARGRSEDRQQSGIDGVGAAPDRRERVRVAVLRQVAQRHAGVDGERPGIGRAARRRVAAVGGEVDDRGRPRRRQRHHLGRAEGAGLDARDDVEGTDLAEQAELVVERHAREIARDRILRLDLEEIRSVGAPGDGVGHGGIADVTGGRARVPGQEGTDSTAERAVEDLGNRQDVAGEVDVAGGDRIDDERVDAVGVGHTIGPRGQVEAADAEPAKGDALAGLHDAGRERRLERHGQIDARRGVQRGGGGAGPVEPSSGKLLGKRTGSVGSKPAGRGTAQRIGRNAVHQPEAVRVTVPERKARPGVQRANLADARMIRHQRRVARTFGRRRRRRSRRAPRRRRQAADGENDARQRD